ncbi:FliM/FliN family flagellar motor switch protein [Albidovulum sediminicola]|uniref:Flagellar motor switch protein FliN n=1 Tax=Albidovulum sediminicola TaxID=2984331 RepID=A0ABT2YW96_9RHOB|nr:FliM/FliN family flagellar motor switch protein [Defluviimonas sp. WL0075]MCV2863139.1 FliM/FliN family flagellar motor switch protein [Defluviimonas sp. WL0075]
MTDSIPERDTAESPLTGIPIEVTISVGRSRIQLKDLLKLRRDAVLPLDRRIEDPVELHVGERLIARGELVELDGEGTGRLGVRLTEIAERPAEG